MVFGSISSILSHFRASSPLVRFNSSRNGALSADCVIWGQPGRVKGRTAYIWHTTGPCSEQSQLFLALFQRTTESMASQMILGERQTRWNREMRKNDPKSSKGTRIDEGDAPSYMYNNNTRIAPKRMGNADNAINGIWFVSFARFLLAHHIRRAVECLQLHDAVIICTVCRHASPDQIIIRSYRFGRYIYIVRCRMLSPQAHAHHPFPSLVPFFCHFSPARTHLRQLHDCKWPLSKICRYITQRIQLHSERIHENDWASQEEIQWFDEGWLRKWGECDFTRSGVKLLWHWTGHFSGYRRSRSIENI